jgi:uncharacterized protein (DUF1499 family)
MTFLVSSSLNIFIDNSQNVRNKLEPCPNSPNCVSTQAVKSKKMEPIKITGSVDTAMEELEEMMAVYENATLVDKEEGYLHYEFLTKIGKFIDDVEFLMDAEAKVIHFRSASQKGYGDFGKNKRRMKMIVRDWGKL